MYFLLIVSFFWGGIGGRWWCWGGGDAWVWMHCLSYGIRGPLNAAVSTPLYIGWQGDLSLVKEKKIFSGAKTCKCISLLFLSRKIHTHKGRTLLSDKRKKKESKKNKLKTWVKTLVWTNKGLIFTSKKVKVTRLVLTVSLYGTKEYTTKPVAHVSQLAAGLKMVEFNWLWRMNYPYVWTKKPLNLISPGQKHNYIPSAMCDSAQNANFNLFCTFEHTQKPIWFSLK